MPNWKHPVIVSIGFAVVFFSSLNSFGQSPVITTYVGPPVLAIGAPAMTQDIGYPVSVAADINGGFYFISNQRIFRVTADGTLTLLAGTGDAGFGGDEGSATRAK